MVAEKTDNIVAHRSPSSGLPPPPLSHTSAPASSPPRTKRRQHAPILSDPSVRALGAAWDRPLLPFSPSPRPLPRPPPSRAHLHIGDHVVVSEVAHHPNTWDAQNCARMAFQAVAAAHPHGELGGDGGAAGAGGGL